MPVADPTAGFSPAPMPPIAADGGPQLEPATVAELGVAPISLCELGPCVHLHRITNRIDSQEPLDGSKGAIHIGTARSCYAQPGVDGPLDQPVLECNKWRPITDHEKKALEQSRSAFRSKKENKDDIDAFHQSWAGTIVTEGA